MTGGILLPGWTCPCGVFNGEAAAPVELCRACAWRKPVDEKIRPSDVAAGQARCESPKATWRESPLASLARRAVASGVKHAARHTPDEAEAIVETNKLVTTFEGGHRPPTNATRAAWDAMVAESRRQLEEKLFAALAANTGTEPADWERRRDQVVAVNAGRPHIVKVDALTMRALEDSRPMTDEELARYESNPTAPCLSCLTDGGDHDPRTGKPIWNGRDPDPRCTVCRGSGRVS